MPYTTKKHQEYIVMKKEINAMFFLQVMLGLMLVSFGILAIQGYNSSGAELVRGVNKLFGKSNDIFPIVFGIIQLAAGIIMLIDLVGAIPENLFRILHIIICIVWLINIVMNFILADLFKPDFLKWLVGFTTQAVILLALWITGKEY